MKRSVLAICAMALGAACLGAVGQMRVGVDGPVPMGKLDEMEQILPFVDAGQKTDLLVRMGVEPAVAKRVVDDLMPGEHIEFQPIRMGDAGQYGLAFLPGGMGVSGYVYLLKAETDKTPKIVWRAVDHREVNCWHGPYGHELMELREQGRDDVVLHHVNLDHGSGIVADQTEVWAVEKERLVPLLAIEDFRDEVTWGTETEHTEQTQSTFLRFPDGRLEETRTSAVNEKPEKVERRYWTWSAEKRAFVDTPFVRVVPPKV